MIKKDKIILILILSMALFLLTGCGSSTVSSSTEIVKEVTNASILNSAWETYAAGGYDAARVSFSSALASSDDLTPEYVGKLNNGLGWATMKVSGFAAAGKYFEKAISYSNDAKIGLAGYYLSTLDKDLFEEGIDLLEDLNISNAYFEYQFENETGITNAQVHALLGVLYYLNGQSGKASPQFSVAGDIINSPGEEVSAQSINYILDQLYY